MITKGRPVRVVRDVDLVDDPLPPLIVAASALGFLIWNWHPARIFLGDVPKTRRRF